MKNKLRSIISLLMVLVALLVASCVDGFTEDEVFSSGVRNTTLESPDSLVFTPNASGSIVTISWPVVYGAGGYQVSFYKVDDPANPVVIGTENQIVDGCSVQRNIEEDTKYKAVVKTLGNTKDNNKEAATATEVAYSTLVPLYATIPTGTDLGAYFQAHPVPSSATELAYELEPNGSYIMSTEVNFGTTAVTFRGNKVHRATVAMSAGFKSQGGGTKFKFINFECSGIPTTSSFFGFTDIPAGSPLTSNAFVVTKPIVFQSCKLTSLPAPLYWDNGKNYAVTSLLINDCIIQQTDNGKLIYNSASNGAIKDFSITNSTVYKNNAGTDYWMQLGGQRFDNIWVTASQTYANNTFYGFDRMHNSNNYSRPGMTINSKSNLFLYELRNGGSARYLLPSGNVNSKVLNFDNNTYTRSTGGADTSTDITNYDKSGTILAEDPACVNPAGGDFTVTNSNTITRGIGDPRWLSTK